MADLTAAADDASRDRTGDLAAAAGSVHASDVFVFRRVTGDRFVHVGGLGRGEGWAGNVELVLSEEPWAHDGLDRGTPVRRRSKDPVRVLGPYYQRFAALVPVSADVVVLFGAADDGLSEATNDDLRAAAAVVGAVIEEVSPAKRLADELEILHAVKALLQTSARMLPDVMQHIVETSAEALSCELGILYVRGAGQVAIADRSAPFVPDAAQMPAILDPLLARPEDLPSCIQDSFAKPLPGPLATPEVTSYYLLPIGDPPFALLALLHTLVQPRGFTLLCRRVGLSLAEASEPLLRAALTARAA